MSIIVKPAGSDPLTTTCASIVVPVNAEGIHSDPLGSAAASKWPDWAQHYRVVRRAGGGLQPGDVDAGHRPDAHCPTVLAMVLWSKRAPSYGWPGLSALMVGVVKVRDFVRDARVRSIALPALGCGYHGLPWDANSTYAWHRNHFLSVKPYITWLAERMSAEGVRVEVYPPTETTLAEKDAG